MSNRGNVEYIINKEKRTVVCIISDCEDVAYNKIRKALRSEGCNGYIDYDRYRIKDRYIGKALCADEDEWDEDFGKKLAFSRARYERAHDVSEKLMMASRRASRIFDKLTEYTIGVQ